VNAVACTHIAKNHSFGGSRAAAAAAAAAAIYAFCLNASPKTSIFIPYLEVGHLAVASLIDLNRMFC
jgi:hypothetical protein